MIYKISCVTNTQVKAFKINSQKEKYMRDVLIAMLSHWKKVITFNILRDGLKSIWRKQDINMDVTEHKYSGNIARLTEK